MSYNVKTLTDQYGKQSNKNKKKKIGKTTLLAPSYIRTM